MGDLAARVRAGGTPREFSEGAKKNQAGAWSFCPHIQRWLISSRRFFIRRICRSSKKEKMVAAAESSDSSSRMLRIFACSWATRVARTMMTARRCASSSDSASPRLKGKEATRTPPCATTSKRSWLTFRWKGSTGFTKSPAASACPAEWHREAPRSHRRQAHPPKTPRLPPRWRSSFR